METRDYGWISLYKSRTKVNLFLQWGWEGRTGYWGDPNVLERAKVTWEDHFSFSSPQDLEISWPPLALVSSVTLVPWHQKNVRYDDGHVSVNIPLATPCSLHFITDFPWSRAHRNQQHGSFFRCPRLSHCTEDPHVPHGQVWDNPG